MKARIDTLLGRISTYRLVSLGLHLMFVVALVAGALGEIPYSVPDLVISFDVLLLVTFLSNRMFAAFFRVVPHTESSIITAVLLFFILTPTSDVKVLGQLALAAMAASGSKYLLAVRGRHIFNPAALGALWLTAFQLSDTVWWIGTPFLLPVTAAVALVVLYRTRHLALGAVFIGVAAVVSVGREVLTDGDLAHAVEFALTNGPVVFIAGLMLTEPLTMPPARRQQLAVAALVGVLFALPIAVGGVTFGPELALIVGNLAAFVLVRRAGVDLVLVEKRRIARKVTELTFRPNRPVTFRAGQHLQLSVPHDEPDARGSRRDFTIVSAPCEDQLLQIAFRVPKESSSYKRALVSMDVGTVVTATGISGDFVLPTDPAVPLLLVARGIGITPFASQLADLHDVMARDIVVMCIVSEAADLAFVDILERSGARVVVLCRSDAESIDAPFQVISAGTPGTDELRRLVPDIAGRRVYISGPPAWVDRVSAAARKVGARRIRRDHFIGY